MTRGDRATFHASACSRPPPPMIRTRTSVPEMTHACEHHCEAVLVGRGDHLGVALRAARLYHGGYALHGSRVDAVAEREKRIRGHHRAGRIDSLVARLHARDPRADDTAHLSRADADRRAVLREHDRVRLDVLADL